MNKKRFSLGMVFTYAVLILATILIMFPVISVITASFKSNSEIMVAPERVFPQDWTFDNYVLAWNSERFQVGRMFFNSLWFSAISVVISLFVATLSGYVFARGVFRGKKIMFTIFSSLMFISLGSITIYPTFEILANFNLSNNLWGLIVLQCFGIPIVDMYMVRGFVNSLPYELDEAARIDGTSFTGTFFRIILPLLKPVVITLALLGFKGSWNNYLMPTLFTMTRPDQHTLIVGIMALKQSGEAASAWNLIFAATVIALVPVLVVFAFGNKHITKGMIAGAVKG